MNATRDDLPKSSHDFRDTFDSVDVGVARLGLGGAVLAANPAVRIILGSEVPIGTQFPGLFADEDRIKYACDALVAAAVDTPSTIDTSVLLPTGRKRAVELRSTVVRGSDGSPEGFTVTMIDRTGRMEARAESERFKAIFEDISELVGIMSPDGTIMSMNRSAAEFFGRNAMSRGLIQFIPPDVVPFLMEEIMPALQRSGQWEGDVELMRHDGKAVPHHVTLRRHSASEADGDYFWAVARNTSMARKAARAEALEQLSAAKDQFIASVSHELRTPLSAIRGFADVLAEGSAPPELIPELIETIRAEAYSMSAIVEDLLVAARAEAGHLSIVPTVLDVRRLVADSLAIVRPATGRSVPSDLAETAIVVADELRARQILRNLVVNSVRHGGAHSWVTTEVTASHVMIHVCDDGPGVDPDLVDDIFDPYVSRKNDGHRPDSVGLGLTVSRQLAQLMGGDVVYSRDDHTTFTLSLPLAD